MSWAQCDECNTWRQLKADQPTPSATETWYCRTIGKNCKKRVEYIRIEDYLSEDESYELPPKFDITEPILSLPKVPINYPIRKGQLTNFICFLFQKAINLPITIIATLFRDVSPVLLFFTTPLLPKSFS